MDHNDKIFEKAKYLHQKNNISGAIKLYEKLISSSYRNAQLLYLLGTANLQLKNYQKAINILSVSIKGNPENHHSYNNIGLAYSEIKDFTEAIKNYEICIKLKPNFPDAYINKGISLKEIGNYEEALKDFKTVLKLSPSNAKVYINLGNLQKEQKEYDEAIKSYEKAISLDEKNYIAYNNLGIIYQELKNYSEALKNFNITFKINSKFEFIVGKILHCKMHLCDWNNYEKLKKEIIEGVKNNLEMIEPFPILGLTDNPKILKRSSEIYSKKKFFYFRKNKFKLNKDKLKIGYFSSDFHSHPVSHLIKDVFKYHNRKKFEVIGFYHGTKNDKWTEEIKRNFDEFIDLNKLKISDIESFIREKNLDIAVNLNGYTSNSKNEVFSKGIARFQINYLGYTGTMGSDFMDYLIADKTVIPKSDRKYFSEKILYLPNCWLPSSKHREISKRSFEKQDFSIPKNKFVFCNFNNIYKITPEIFKIWMNILLKSDESILWLISKNNIVKKNLRLEAKKRGVEPNRIIFSDPMNIEDHLKRIQLADLFLDTFPYNAHLTAIDAIRVGLPVLTISGNSLPSRGADSILQSANISNLCKKTFKEYQDSAIELANNRKKYKIIRESFQNCINSELFNIEQFTKNLEKIYLNLV